MTSKECVNLHYLESCLFVHTFRLNVITIIRKRSNQVSMLQKKKSKQACKDKTHVNEKCTPYHSQFNFQNWAPETLILTNAPTECCFTE